MRSARPIVLAVALLGVTASVAAAGPSTPEFEARWNQAGAEYRTAHFDRAYATLASLVSEGESLDDANLRQAFLADRARIACMTRRLDEAEAALGRLTAYRAALPPPPVFVPYNDPSAHLSWGFGLPGSKLDSLTFSTLSDYRRAWGTIARSPYKTSGSPGPATASSVAIDGQTLWDVKYPYSRINASEIQLPGIGSSSPGGTTNDVNGSGWSDGCLESMPLDAYIVGKENQTVSVDPRGNLELELACAFECAGSVQIRLLVPNDPGERPLGSGSYHPPSMTGRLLTSKPYDIGKRRSFIRLRISKPDARRAKALRGKWRVLVGIAPSSTQRFQLHRKTARLRLQKKLVKPGASTSQRIATTLVPASASGGRTVGGTCKDGKFSGTLSLEVAAKNKTKDDLVLRCPKGKISLIGFTNINGRKDGWYVYRGSRAYAGYQGSPVHATRSGSRLKLQATVTKSTGRTDPFTERH